MNVRINELANECYYFNTCTDLEMFDKEKFANLIVAECAEVCLAQRDPANLNYKPSVKFAEAINQHFGVEE